jgi:flagellar biosynthesis chaperone FliJ
MDPQIIPEVLTLLTPEQSAANKDLVLNFLLATTALAGTVISAYFIKRAGISLNSFNYIRRKVFRDQNRLGTQLHKNRDKVELIKAKIAVIEELKDKNKDLFNEIFVKKHFEQMKSAWRSQITIICGGGKVTSKTVKEIIKSINGKINKFKNLPGDQNDLIIKGLSDLKKEIEENINEYSVFESNAERNFDYDIKVLKSDIEDKKSEINSFNNEVDIQTKEYLEGCMSLIEKLIKNHTIEEPVLTSLQSITNKRKINTFYSELCKIKDKHPDDWNEDSFSNIRDRYLVCKTHTEHNGLKKLIDKKTKEVNKLESLSKEFNSIFNKLLISNTITKDVDDTISVFNTFTDGKLTLTLNIKKIDLFMKDIKNSILYNLYSGKNEYDGDSGTLTNFDFKHAVKDISVEGKNTYDNKIKKLNKDNNKFDFYDLQISDQIQVSRIYQEIMFQKDREKDNRGGE